MQDIWTCHNYSVFQILFLIEKVYGENNKNWITHEWKELFRLNKKHFKYF